MIPASGSGDSTARRRAGLRALVLGLSAVCLIFPAALSGQLLEELRANYRSARANYQAQLSALEVVENAWLGSLDSMEVARSRSEDDLNRAYFVARARARTKSDQNRLVAEADSALGVSRANLRAALVRRIGELGDEYDGASTARQEDLDILIDALDREIATLDSENRELAVRPTQYIVTIDPIDRPAEIRAKAALLDRRADEADEEILELDNRIRELSDRLRLDQRRRDARANRDRFDDVRVPVGSSVTGSTGERGANPVAADSLGVPQPRTLEEEIAILQALRDELVAWRDGLRGTARNFRTRAGGDR